LNPTNFLTFPTFTDPKVPAYGVYSWLDLCTCKNDSDFC